MDSGHLEPGETLEDDYDVLRELLPEEIIGIMDQMLCFEVIPTHEHYKAINNSDTDTRYGRWRGIWALHSRSLCSLRCTSTGCYGLSRRVWKMHVSNVMRPRDPETSWYILYFGLIAWAC